MCALAHFFEEEGLATTVVALVREHAEKMRPPRALWVPFELGRPFGDPGMAVRQSEVLKAALDLLQVSTSKPILENFNAAVQESNAEGSWGFPGALETADAQEELIGIRPFWEKAKRRHGRTTVGISDMSPENAIEFVRLYHSANPMPNPKGMAKVARARFSIDDIKAFYLEAATAVGNPTSEQLQNWFWQQTLAGAMILAFQERARLSDDKNLNLIAGSLVPAERVLSRD